VIRFECKPAGRRQHENRKFSTGDILLLSQLLVSCNQQIEGVLRSVKKLTIMKQKGVSAQF
jgi:hypothetical protein